MHPDNFVYFYSIESASLKTESENQELYKNAKKTFLWVKYKNPDQNRQEKKTVESWDTVSGGNELLYVQKC